MAKPDPALLDVARYPFSTVIEPRFGDLDVNNHLNNVAIAGLFEEGRVRFHRASGYHDALQGMSAMAASLAVEYLGQALYPEPLQVYVSASRLGRTSHTVSELILQNGAVVAYAEAVLVCLRDGRPAEHPAAFLESIRPWMLRP